MVNTITLDGNTIHVKSLRSSTDLTSLHWDKWDAGVYKKKTRVLGGKEHLSFTCYERNVVWNSSACKALKTKALLGTTASLVIDKGTLHAATLTVFILNVTLVLEADYGADIAAPALYREFTVEVEEE